MGQVQSCLGSTRTKSEDGSVDDKRLLDVLRTSSVGAKVLVKVRKAQDGEPRARAVFQETKETTMQTPFGESAARAAVQDANAVVQRATPPSLPPSGRRAARNSSPTPPRPEEDADHSPNTSRRFVTIGPSIRARDSSGGGARPPRPRASDTTDDLTFPSSIRARFTSGGGERPAPTPNFFKKVVARLSGGGRDPKDIAAFCLGVALFQDQAAQSNSKNRCPNTFRVAFRDLKLSPDEANVIYNSLCKTNRATFAWALATAPRAEITLTLKAKDDAWMQDLRRARQGLQSRGLLPTAVTVVYNEEVDMFTRVDSLVLLLEAHADIITELNLENPNPRDDHRAEMGSILYRALRDLPKLTSLSIGPVSCVLPPSTELPHITHLSFTVPASARGEVSVIKYAPVVGDLLPNITSLQLRRAETAARAGRGDVAAAGAANAPAAADAIPVGVKWPELLNATTRLTTFTELDDTLLGLVLECAPGLAYLSVSGVALKTNHVDKVWAVETLVRTGKPREDDELYFLRYLPKRSAEGRLRVSDPRSTARLVLESAQGLRATLRLRMREMSFDFKAMNFNVYTLDAPIKPIALYNALEQLRDMEAPGVPIYIPCDKWLNDLFRDAAPNLTHLKLCVNLRTRVFYERALTDKELVQISLLGQHIRCLSAEQFAVESPDLCVPWHWDEMAFYETDVARMVVIPAPHEAWKRRTVCTSAIVLSQDVEEVGAERIIAWLKTVRFTPLTDNTITISISCPEDKPSVQRTLLDLLPSIKDALADPSTKLTIDIRWPLTMSSMALLQYLPLWSKTLLSLTACTWPLNPTKYMELAKCIPACYDRWRINSVTAGRALLFASTGMEAHRIAVGKPLVRIETVGGLKRGELVGDHFTVLESEEDASGLPAIEYVGPLVPMNEVASGSESGGSESGEGSEVVQGEVWLGIQ